MAKTQPACGWVDELGASDCPDEPIDFILLRDKLVAGRVLVCRKHKAEYNRTAAAARVARRDEKKEGKVDWPDAPVAGFQQRF